MVVLSDSDIRKLLPQNVQKRFKGIYMSNEIPKRQKGLYIFNLDNTHGDASLDNDSIGTHWVGLSIEDHKAEYFDPFGKPPDDTVVKWLKRGRKHFPIWYSTSPIQDMDSSNCGFYVIDFLTDMVNGVDFYDAIHKYDIRDTKRNERTISAKYSITENNKGFTGRGFKI